MRPGAVDPSPCTKNASVTNQTATYSLPGTLYIGFAKGTAKATVERVATCLAALPGAPSQVTVREQTSDS
jgi:hypothetical protein